MKVEVSSIFKEKIQKSENKSRTRSVASAVHHLYHYATEDLPAIVGLI